MIGSLFRSTISSNDVIVDFEEHRLKDIRPMGDIYYHDFLVSLSEEEQIMDGQLFSVFRHDWGTLPDGTEFTDLVNYWVCEVDVSLKFGSYLKSYAKGYVRGKFSVLAHGDQSLYAPKLMNLWGCQPRNERTKDWAEKCDTIIGSLQQLDAKTSKQRESEEEYSRYRMSLQKNLMDTRKLLGI
jgi:hypothetical protein